MWEISLARMECSVHERVRKSSLSRHSSTPTKFGLEYLRNTVLLLSQASFKL